MASLEQLVGNYIKLTLTYKYVNQIPILSKLSIKQYQEVAPNFLDNNFHGDFLHWDFCSMFKEDKQSLKEGGEKKGKKKELKSIRKRKKKKKKKKKK